MNVFFAFLIYSFLFLCVGGSIITYYFDFSPFACFSWSTKELFINPFSDWHTLYIDFQHDNWAINSFKNLMIFFIFLFFYPAWIGLWFLVKRIKWNKFFSKPVYLFKRRFGKKEEIKMPDVSSLAKTTGDRPLAMRKSSNFGNPLLMAQAQEEQNKEVNDFPTNEPASFLKPSFEAVNVNQKEQLRALGEKYGYELFEKVQMDDLMVPFVFATDTVALVTTVLMDDREWIADEDVSEDGSEPTWFSAEGLISSPFSRMVKAAAFLREKEPDSEIVPVVVVGAGSILNAEIMEEKWSQMGGRVVVWNEEKHNGLETLEDLFQEKNKQNGDIEHLNEIIDSVAAGEKIPQQVDDDAQNTSENADFEIPVEPE